MRSQDLKKFVSKIPDDMEMVISNAVIIDAEDKIYGVVDIPICGIILTDAEDGEPKELRFVLHTEAVKSVFKEEQIIPIDDIQL